MLSDEAFCHLRMCEVGLRYLEISSTTIIKLQGKLKKGKFTKTGKIIR